MCEKSNLRLFYFHTVNYACFGPWRSKCHNRPMIKAISNAFFHKSKFHKVTLSSNSFFLRFWGFGFEWWDFLLYLKVKTTKNRLNLICKCWLVFVHVIVIISSLRDIKCRLSKLFLLLRSNCLSLKKRHFLKCSFTPAIKSRSQSKIDNLIY